jgi:hypothetical protein
MQQLGSHWTDFHEILYLSIFRKSVWEYLGFIKIWHDFTWRPVDIYDCISHIYSQKFKILGKILLLKSKTTFFCQ